MAFFPIDLSDDGRVFGGRHRDVQLPRVPFFALVGSTPIRQRSKGTLSPIHRPHIRRCTFQALFTTFSSSSRCDSALAATLPCKIMQGVTFQHHRIGTAWRRTMLVRVFQPSPSMGRIKGIASSRLAPRAFRSDCGGTSVLSAQNKALPIQRDLLRTQNGQLQCNAMQCDATNVLPNT